MKEILSRVKRCLPSVVAIANETLNLLEKELNVSTTVKANVCESGDKIIINVNLPRINKNDLDFNFTEDSFSITVETGKKELNTSN